MAMRGLAEAIRGRGAASQAARSTAAAQTRPIRERRGSFAGGDLLRQTPIAGERGKLGLRKLHPEFRGALQMIEGGGPILRNARSHGGADRQIMRGFRLGFPAPSRKDAVSIASRPVSNISQADYAGFPETAEQGSS